MWGVRSQFFIFALLLMGFTVISEEALALKCSQYFDYVQQHESQFLELLRRNGLERVGEVDGVAVIDVQKGRSTFRGSATHIHLLFQEHPPVPFKGKELVIVVNDASDGLTVFMRDQRTKVALEGGVGTGHEELPRFEQTRDFVKNQVGQELPDSDVFDY